MARTGRPATPIRYRFLARIDFDITPGCWEWTGAKTFGYGLIGSRDGVLLRAHRVAYELAYGPIPTGLFVCHHCDNPGCVRPSHLFLGTPADNMADKVIKGRLVHMYGERNGRAKLSAADVILIRASDDSYPCIARRFGVTPSAVGLIKRRKLWKHL
ncbi:HNH endonuclease signature motif containing protein [Iodobacter sp.]|uniref:HNH endonuclease signature motif containing protein n=1 Tax=Iodobacter sp. TaxID=1915058 RepID=UPI0035B650FE